MFSKVDTSFMRRAMQLAQRGQYTAAPNPLVGCVIVGENGTVIGEGYHAAYGQNHAEANAFHSIAPEHRDELPNSTWYVTLEPCNHVGNTPACAGLIEREGAKRVVIGHVDPNPRVAGGGLQRLRKAGIEVASGCLEAELKWQNRRFFWNAIAGKPWIVLKWAESADGFMDGRTAADRTPGSGGFAITGTEAQRLTHRWRAEEMGIAVGAQTALVDEPQLTVRHVDAPSPTVVLLDPHGKIPSSLPHVSDRKDVIHVCANPQDSISDRHCPWAIEDGLEALLRTLYRDHGVSSILVEGGATVLNAFLQDGCWNEIKRWKAPVSLGTGLKAPALPASFGTVPSNVRTRGTAGEDAWEHFVHPQHLFD